MAVLYLKYIDGSIPVILHGVLCLLAYIFWSVLALVAVPVMAIFRFFKLFEYALISYQKLGTVFSTFDKVFLHETKNNRNFIIGMVEVEGDPNIDKLRKLVLSRLFDKKRELDKTYKRLSQKISRRYLSYIWTNEENFNIKRHMPVYKGTIPKDKKDVEQIFSKFATEHIPQDISPWLFCVIPKKDRKGFFIFCKLHHCIGDGFAMVGLLSQLVDEKPKFISLSSRKVGFMANSVRRVVSGVLTGPLALLALTFSINLRHPFEANTSPDKKSVSWTVPISLDLVKKIKSKTGCTVNDVLMSCLAGAIGSYLDRLKTKKPTDLPVAMTFNSRSASEKLKKIVPLGNHSGGLFLNLPIATKDPLKRLEETSDRINKMKKLSHPQLFSFIYFNIVGSLPEIFGRYSTFAMKKHVALIYSNVPGPTDTLYILGQPVKGIVITPPLHADMGLVVSLFSYNNWIELTVMTDEKVIADPSKLTKAFEHEVQLLAERILIDD